MITFPLLLGLCRCGADMAVRLDDRADLPTHSPFLCTNCQRVLVVHVRRFAIDDGQEE